MFLYIHIPFCISKCAYCDFFSRPFSSVPDAYVSALCNELDFRLKNADAPETIYIGGGTPSLLFSEQLQKIISHIPMDNIREFTVEVNPDDVTEKLLRSFQDAGVTRISCGVQSFNDQVLHFVNRRAKREQVLNALENFEKYWEGELSLDLISGLPYETEESFMEGLRKVVDSKANHLSLYSLTIEDETPLGKMVEEGIWDYDFEKADSMWLKGRDFLESCGYSQYEVSNFCKDGKYSLHNMAYWDHKSYIGCGSGATGTFYKEDGTALRWTNTSRLETYISFWNNTAKKYSGIPEDKEDLDRETEKFEFFMMGLRTIKGIKEQDFRNVFGESLPENFITLFKDWSKKDLAEVYAEKGGRVFTLGKKGILFLNRFLTELDNG